MRAALLLLSLVSWGFASGPQRTIPTVSIIVGAAAPIKVAAPSVPGASVLPVLPPPTAGLVQPPAQAAASAPASPDASAGAQLSAAANPGADFGRAFDNAGPAVPEGALRVSVDVVRDARDVARLIPSGPNSSDLVAKLQREARRMAPYRVFTYHDARGGTFTAIDLSEKPSLIDHFPEQHSHEIKLVKKIQLWNKDLQLVVREDGATPDIVLGGVMTELKSLLGSGAFFTDRLEKANGQVREHAKRHGLGHGAVVVDFTRETRVPVDELLGKINKWSASNRDVVLDKIFVFAGTDLKAFVRDDRGTYRVEDPRRMPVAPKRSVRPDDAETVRTLLQKGRLHHAERLLRRAPPGDFKNPLTQARFELEAQRLFGRVTKFLRQGRESEARRAWKGFVSAYGARAQALEPRLLELVERAGRAKP